jgi:serine/threonine-protein kinase
MTPEQRRRVNELFDAALTLATDCRAAFVADRCPDDPAVRAEALSLLGHGARAEACGFLEGRADGPPTELTAEASDPCLPEAPQVFAGYEILGELGRGGMGVVYKARQVALGRLVALKTLRARADADPEERARFRAEAAAVGRLQHPNVVQIHEVGEGQGRPYFALEYLEGGSLAQKLAGTPLPAPEAAALVRTLADAVAAAHQCGIVHRDLKPGNVLLTADGVPKVADFGLAKGLEGGTGYTATGVPMGTPSYMAPEQANGDAKAIGPRTDIYALGAVLYELLTGRPPFRGPSPLDTVVQVRTQEPVPPRRLQPKVPRDLETICLKCLEKEPGRRYPSAAALADDVDRFLAGSPIAARPLGLWGRGIKWARRRPALAALLAVSAGAAVLLLGIVLAYNAHLRQVNIQLQEAVEQTNRQRTLAREVSHLARKTLASLARVNQDPRLRDHDLEDLHKELLQSSIAFYELRSDDPELEAERASACALLGSLLGELGLFDEALRYHQEAQTAYKRLERDRLSGAGYRAQIAGILKGLGGVYHELGEFDQEKAAQTEAADLLDRLVQEEPANTQYRVDLAATKLRLGSLYLTTDRPELATPALARARELWEALIRREPAVTDHRLHLAFTVVKQVFAYKYNRHFRPGQAAFGEAESMLQELTSRYRADPTHELDLAQVWFTLGQVYLHTDRPQRAEDPLREAVKIQADLVQRHPKRWTFRHDLGKMHNELALQALYTNKLKTALQWCKSAFEHLQSVPQVAHPFVCWDLAWTYNYRASAYMRLWQNDQARRDFDQAIQLARNRGLRLWSQLYRAVTLARLHKYTLAIDDANEVYKAAKVGENRFVPESSIYYYDLARVYAICAPAVQKDNTLPPALRAQQAESYGARAVELLALAQQNDHFTPEKLNILRTEKEMESLRSRRDYQKFLQTCAAKK